mmetsp:Transcript_45101/g.80680  ORF Transcript_45101/g.80680 Transcript_45101/m.80680 type:complete len:189 (-) Transcript_45101:906-1472(-)
MTSFFCSVMEIAITSDTAIAVVVTNRPKMHAMNTLLNMNPSPNQARGCEGRTTTGQAIAMWAELARRGVQQYVCLLDIAKAFPSAPYPSLINALSIIGAPPRLMAIVTRIYHASWNVCTTHGGTVRYKLLRGIKEGCPLSPVLLMLLYDAFHVTLRRAFPEARFFVYVDDIANVTSSVEELQRILGAL